MRSAGAGSVVVRATNGRLSSRAALFQIIVTQPPAPRAANFTAGPFKQGSPPQSIDVLAHVTDPTGKGLHIVAASVAGAAGSVQWDRGVGGRLRYAPRATFSGQTQIFVTVGDATGVGEPSGRRDRDGRGLRAADGPTVAPTVSARTDTSTNTPFFALDWSAGPALPKGAAIDHYQVNWSGGDRVDETCVGSGPRCGFAGLSFAHAYAFRVRAVDVYGEAGPWGPASASQRYDVAPPAVSSATAQFDVTSSTSIDLTWTPPGHHAGSDIRFYDIYVGGGLLTSVPAPQTSARIGGLTTGQPYEFTIKTRNASNEQSEGVTTTPPVRPLAVPTFVPAPHRDREPERERLGRRVVADSVVADRHSGDGWRRSREPPVLRGRRRRNAATGCEPRLLQLLQPDRGHAYQIKLGVANSLVAKTCHGALSSCAKYLGGTVSFTTYGPPSAVTDLAATANAPQQLSLTFTPGTLPAGSPSDLQSKVYLTAVDPAIPGLDLSSPIEITSGFSTPANLSTGQQYDFTVLACAVPSSTPTRKFCETTSQSTSGTPYGPPGAPSQPSGAVDGLARSHGAGRHPTTAAEAAGSTLLGLGNRRRPRHVGAIRLRELLHDVLRDGRRREQPRHHRPRLGARVRHDRAATATAGDLHRVGRPRDSADRVSGRSRMSLVELRRDQYPRRYVHPSLLRPDRRRLRRCVHDRHHERIVVVRVRRLDRLLRERELRPHGVRSAQRARHLSVFGLRLAMTFAARPAGAR